MDSPEGTLTTTTKFKVRVSFATGIACTKYQENTRNSPWGEPIQWWIVGKQESLCYFTTGEEMPVSISEWMASYEA